MLSKNMGIALIATFALFNSGCKDASSDFFAAGTFEGDEVILSSEVAGKMNHLFVEEGDTIAEGKKIAFIDTVQLALQLEQAEASLAALPEKLGSADPQVVVLQKQSEVAESQVQALRMQFESMKREQSRMVSLYQGGAATQQQKEDIDTKVAVLEKQLMAAKEQKEVVKVQMTAAKQQVAIQNRAIRSEAAPMQKKVDLLRDQLGRTQIVAPFSGTVLAVFTKKGEWVAPGKPVVKIADLDNIWLHAYISANMLQQIKMGQEVSVWVDEGIDKQRKYQGTVSWIASQAEFTPKTIQTRDERANLVYGVKIRVKNDGLLKLGMYGELRGENTAE